MNIRCPGCQTVFRVDPARVPAGGIKARCSRCGTTFHVAQETHEAVPPAAVQATAPSAAEQTVRAAAADARPASMFAPPGRAETRSREVAGAGVGGTAATERSQGMSATVPVPSRNPTPSATPRTDAVPAAPSPEAPRPNTFGSRDPNARAQRIARALVSDIIAYHPKRWESSHKSGTLRSEFREEILKSWEEYVAQVGLELARSTPHFRAALNDILARGQQIF